MPKTYDRKICLKNLSLLVERKKLKIGALEQSVGVSPGYLSRLSREDNTTKLSIELLVALSEELEVSVDTLACVDLSAMTPNEQYIFLFIEKLLQDTNYSGLTWTRESMSNFSSIKPYQDGTTSHPLFCVWNNSVVYNSAFNKRNKPCEVFGDFYHTKLSDGNTLYLTRVKDAVNCHIENELYLVKYNDYDHYFVVDPICASSLEGNSAFNSRLMNLYDSVKDSCKHVAVSKSVRKAIDTYMNPPKDPNPFEELEDDGELPF